MTCEVAQQAAGAFRLLFYRTDGGGTPLPPASPFLCHIEALLNAAPENLAFQLNALSRFGDAAFCAQNLLGALFDSCVDHGVLPDDYRDGTLSEDAGFLLGHGDKLLKFLRQLPDTAMFPEQILPRARRIFDRLPDTGSTAELGKLLVACDPFVTDRIFTWKRGKFQAVQPASRKEPRKFFGFPGVRLAFEEHFSAFAAGSTNLPLIVNSLPGYGKTSMIVSYALAAPETTLILPGPEALENDWDQLITALAARNDHRFVLFFDDIDPRQVNWYSFRTNVGGAFAPPDNVMPVLAANYEFPPSILSRGRKITYPVFDEERCMEMIEDFLISFGMKHPPRNIVSLMGAEYTEEFGQKKFTELSPRTLMRYLAGYENNPRRRSQIVDLAAGKMITRPDAQLFYEFNIELMRSMYGEEYIQRLLKERLREL